MNEKIAAADTPAARLRWARENRSSHKTASAAVAPMAGRFPPTLGHENGDRAPSQATARKYAAAYGVAWHWILGGGERPSVKGNPFDVPDLGSDPMSDDEFDALWKACPNQPGMVRILQRMEGFTPYQVGVVIGYVMRMTEEKR